MRIPYEILLAALTGEATDDQLRALRRWRRADPRHEEVYRELEATWSETGRLQAPAGTGAPPPVEEIIGLAEREPAAARAVAGIRRLAPPAPRWRAWGLMAAALAGLALVPILAGRNPGGFAAQEFRTGEGERATVSFSDGTVVLLAPQSSLTVVRSDRSREVVLGGGAYFAVSPDPERPFVVQTSAGAATVLGTRFSVRAREGSLDVAVVEGEVAVAGTEGEARVKANQIARVVDGGQPEVESVPDVFAELDWMGDFLGLESTPLENVVAELQERFGVRIQVVDEVLLQRTVTGWFTDQPVEEIVDAICQAVDAVCSVRDGVVLMQTVRR